MPNLPTNLIEFTHCGAHVTAAHDGAFGYDWTAVLGGVLFAKGWIRGDADDARLAKGWIRGDADDTRGAIEAFLNDLDFEGHVSALNPRYPRVTRHG